MDEYLTFEDENLDKNQVTRDEVKQVLESELSFAEELKPSERGKDRVMIIGWTHSGRVLEIGLEYLDANREHVFHAMNAGKGYPREFDRRLS